MSGLFYNSRWMTPSFNIPKEKEKSEEITQELRDKEQKKEIKHEATFPKQKNQVRTANQGSDKNN